MSLHAPYFVPDDDTLRELGRLQVLHSQVDHALRITIHRLLGISINDAGYWTETRGMTAALRERARSLISQKYAADDNKEGILNKVLDDAEGATVLRNRALHSVWMKASGGNPFLYDRDFVSKAHVKFELPTIENLAELNARLRRIFETLDSVTKELL